jgi:hypothetical protein
MFQERFRRGSALPAGRPLRFSAFAVLAAILGSVGPVAHAQFPPPARSPGQARVSAAAAQATAALPPARRILDRHVEAIGGREAYLKHSSMHLRGTLSVPAAGMTGTLESFHARPNKSLLKVSLEGVGEVRQGFDGTHGWSLSPMTGPMLQDGQELADNRFEADFQRELKPDSHYVSITTIEQTDFDGRPCYKVRLVRKAGREDIEFYDVATGLRAGSIVTRETHMGEVTSTIVETDYRKFGNLLLPTTFRQQMGPIEQVLKIAVVEYDTVDPSVFALPDAIKALIK